MVNVNSRRVSYYLVYFFCFILEIYHFGMENEQDKFQNRGLSFSDDIVVHALFVSGLELVARRPGCGNSWFMDDRIRFG